MSNSLPITNIISKNDCLVLEGLFWFSCILQFYAEKVQKDVAHIADNLFCPLDMEDVLQSRNMDGFYLLYFLKSKMKVCGNNFSFFTFFLNYFCSHLLSDKFQQMKIILKRQFSHREFSESFRANSDIQEQAEQCIIN
jgi:hypothetical protein